MGTNAVGAMIVAGPEGFVKSQYRKFNIRGTDLTPGDDFGMMREVLTRRFARLAKEDPDRQSGAWPDLVLIDGGPGQVAAACAALAELGIDEVAVVGVAKGVDRDAGKEEFHRPGQPPMALGHRDPVLYFVQRLRDEAHRFAIGAHRAEARRPDPGDAARRGAGGRRGAQAGAARAFRLGQGGQRAPASPTSRRRPESPTRSPRRSTASSMARGDALYPASGDRGRRSWRGCAGRYRTS